MKDVKGKNVMIVGLGKVGVSLSQFLLSLGANVTISDHKSPPELAYYLEQIEDLDINYDLGEHSLKLFLKQDLLILSPGVSPELKVIQYAKNNGVTIIGEMEFVSAFIQKPIIAVTGTNGKTTTVKLIRDFLHESGVKVWAGGNYGEPASAYLLSKKKVDVVILEVSSFQLEMCKIFTPKTIVFTNLSENHLDRHKTFEAYIQAKKQIFVNNNVNTTCILNADDTNIVALARDPIVYQKSVIFYFSTNPYFKQQIMTIGGVVQIGKELQIKATPRLDFLSLEEMKLKGSHSVENIMAALLAAMEHGANMQAIKKVVYSFKGLPHRLEYVRRVGGVLFYNDSKATNVQSVRTALSSFDENIILVMGGKDTGLNYESLADDIRVKVKTLILVGEAKEKINRDLGGISETLIIGTFDEAIYTAYQKSRVGDTVLLSPGCSSFDVFDSYAERGNHFKRMVNEFNA